MNNLKAPSLQSLLESDRGSNDSLLAESLQLDIEELDDAEYSIPVLDTLPTLESVLNDLDSDFDYASDTGGQTQSHSVGLVAPTPTPSVDDSLKQTSILRHVILQGVTAQITSAAERVNAGTASSVAIKNKIAVGTSHGHILCFDMSQTLRWCCREFSSQGAVSALSFNEDSSRLLAGFARGHIIMIDTAKGDVIRSLTDVITPNTGVLHIKWTERPALALCADSGGSVWYLSFTRRLGIRGCSSRCLFSGARGEVCSVEPLLLGDGDHPLKANSIVALATLSKYFVVMIRPRLKVIKFQAMTGPANCLPLLAWQMVLIQAADSSRTVDPVLAAGRGNQLFFHQLCYNQGRMNLLFLRKIVLDYTLLSLDWIGPKSIVCLDTTELLHLAEVRTNKELECIDMAGAGLVYGSAQFKGLATGGNVSPALALAGSSACYNSVIATETHLYILGAKCLQAVSVRSWAERITHLSGHHRWAEAIDICVEFYRSVSDRPRRQILAKEKILHLFNEYLINTTHCPELCLGAIISCLIEIEEIDLLWGELYERLTSKHIYFQLISEHIENGRLTMISPIVSQALIDYWARKSTNKLEEIILKLSWECLDLHQVLTLSKRHKLYQSQMHLNTKALGDYTVSLTELIPLVLTEEPALGNCLLVYISSCLAGRGYPTGEIAENLIPSVKHEVLRCLTVIHSSLAAEDEPVYPYLRTLLKFNTREILNVLSLAFQEKEFDGEIGQTHRQRIINILLEIMTPDTATWKEIGCLLHFISQQIALKNLPDDESLVRRILNYLSMEDIEGESPRQHYEREQAWLELLQANSLTFLSLTDLLNLARKSKCYHVVEHILEMTKTYDNIIEECYLKDKLRYNQIFGYLQKHVKNPKRLIYLQVINNFLLLFEINADELIGFILEHFSDRTNEFIKLIKNDPYNFYIFLNNLFRNLNNTNSSGSQNATNTTSTTTNLIDLEKYSEDFLRLLCQFNPENVDQFLKNHNNLYKLDNALIIVKEYNLKPSLIYLYEKKGDYNEAFIIYTDMLNDTSIEREQCEVYALEAAALCSRASEHVSDVEKETLWFKLLNLILARDDLSEITKNVLHLSSRYVDLQKLVQLVLGSGKKDNNFGDIKHLIVGMLSNSRYEQLLLQTTSRILGHDLHNLLAREKKHSNQGVCVKSIKCVICRRKLYNGQYGATTTTAVPIDDYKDINNGGVGSSTTSNGTVNSNITIYGNCGHSVHEECAPDTTECPRCGTLVREKISVAHTTLEIVEQNDDRLNEIYSRNGLNLCAPPRFGAKRK